MFEHFLRQRKAFCFGVYLPSRGKIGGKWSQQSQRPKERHLGRRELGWGREGGREGEKKRREGRSKEKL